MTKIKVLVKRENQIRWISEEIADQGGLEKIIGGSIDCISLPCNIDLWVNDNMIGDMGINLMLLWDEKHEYHQVIFGPVVLTGVNQQGKTVSLNELQRKWIAKHLRVAKLSNGNQICAIDLTDGGAIA